MSEPIGLDWFRQVTCLSLLLSWLERFEKDFSALVVIAFWIYWLLTWLSHAQIQGTRVLVGIKYEWVWFIMFQLPKVAFCKCFVLVAFSITVIFFGAWGFIIENLIFMFFYRKRWMYLKGILFWFSLEIYNWKELNPGFWFFWPLVHFILFMFLEEKEQTWNWDSMVLLSKQDFIACLWC